MKNFLLTLLALVLSLTFINAQVTVLEDFEGGSKIGWNTEFGDGVFTVVDNPAVADTTLDPGNINRSAQVGSYVKGETGFSLLISILDDSLDLSTNNRFTVQIYAPVASAILFKIEGDQSIGEFYEVEKNIATSTTNRWIEYSFDMSPAANFTTINKIILFFDPGNATSKDTYLFDNLTVGPADACAGTMATAGVVDDFECQRNISIGAGFFDIDVIDNPDASGINTSSTVGAFNDSRGGAFHALVYDYGDGGLDLSTLNVIKTKVWAPFASRVVVKLEGGTSGPIEKDFMIEAAQEWVQLSVDFSEVAAANYTRLVYFFNAFEEPGAEDIFFIDDVQWEEVPPAAALEDFEDGGKLSWGPLNDNADLNGTFEIVANPDMMGNESANIGSYAKGTSQFSALNAFLLEGLDLSTSGQLNLQVWAPAGSATVEMQLVSPTSGVQSVTRDITATEEWIEVNFNFEDFSSVTDFDQLNLVFDSGTEAAGTTYFLDNLTQSAGTVDPCEGVEANPNIADDFDCQRNVPIIVGGDVLQAIGNPDASGINPDPLDKVGEYTDPFGDWDAIVYDFGEPIDLSVRNQLHIKVWSPEVVPMLFKLEGGTIPPVEIFMDVSETSTWVEYILDFSEVVDNDHSRLAIFMNAGQTQAEQIIYYIDDIFFGRAPYSACVADYDTPNFSLDGWGYFPDGDDNPGVASVANPLPEDPNNMSEMVGYFFERGNGSQPWAGMFNALEAPITLPNDNKTITMKVLGPVAGTIVMKLESGSIDPGNTGDTPAEYTTPGEWQVLTFDFTTSPAPAPDGNEYSTLTLIPNITEIPTVDQEWYFDDIQIGGSACEGNTLISSIFSPVTVDQLEIMPNPVRERLQILNTNDISHFAIFNTLGQRFHLVKTTGQTSLELTVDHLPKGMYVLAGYDENGALKANAKFIKE